VVDPPAFVKAKKDLPTGLKGYRKLAQLACRLVEPGGVLFAASCSHNVDATTFFDQVSQGLSRAKRSGRVLRQSGAGPDHPVHPFLPESAYLKGLLLQLD
jgi:23S rRNA (cytosine1962-C5)-methyltransferase